MDKDEREEMDRQNKTRPFEYVDRAEFERRLRTIEATLDWMNNSDNILTEELDELTDRVEALEKTVSFVSAPNTGKDQNPQPDSDGTLGWRRHVRPAKQEAEWPQEGDEYWWIASWMFVQSGEWHSDYITDGIRDFLGIYPTREQAEEAAGKIKRVMDHLREGHEVDLAKWQHNGSARIKKDTIKL